MLHTYGIFIILALIVLCAGCTIKGMSLNSATWVGGGVLSLALAFIIFLLETVK
jgi:hypothetical protein